MTDVMWGAVGLGVIVGGAIAAIKLKKHRPAEKTAETELEKLVNHQLICDDLDMSKVIAWFRENAEKANGNAVFFLAKPTLRTAEMFAVTADIQQLDQEHNLLQVVVDQKENLPVAVRLIACSSKPALIAERMEGKDYMIITNN